MDFKYGFPDEIRSEITRHLDVPSSGLLQRTVRQWSSNRKFWCTEEYINRVFNTPVTMNEIEALYEEVEPTRPIFTVTVGMLQEVILSHVGVVTVTGRPVPDQKFHDATVRLRVFDPSTMITRIVAAAVRSEDATHYESFHRKERQKSIMDGVRSIESNHKYSKMWADPYTTRLIMRRRLINCNVREPSLFDYFPLYDADGPEDQNYVMKYDSGDDYADDYIYSYVAMVAHDLYVLGVASIHGLYDLRNFDDSYRHNPRSGRYDRIEVLRSQLEDVL